jgi:hypothetical protein
MGSEEKRWKDLCHSYGFGMHLTVTALCVITNKSAWHISLTSVPIKLYHSNFNISNYKQQKYKDTYHKQRLYFHSVEKALRYIYIHDKYRYTDGEKSCQKIYELFRQIEKRAA